MRWLVSATLAALMLYGPSSAMQRTPSATVGDIPALIDAGRYEDAEAKAALAVERAPAPEADRARELLLTARLRNGRGAEAPTRDLARSLVDAALSSAAPPDDLALRLQRLGEVLHESADYKGAITAFREAIAIRERDTPGESPALAESLEGLVHVLTDELPRDPKTLDEALALAQRAMSIREASGDGVGIARALQMRGEVWQSKTDFARARPDFERSLELYELNRASHPETAVALLRLGEEYWFEGAFAPADQHVSRACALNESTLRPGHPEIANCLRLLALGREELSELNEAKALRERALAIAEAAFGPDHPRVAIQLNDLANNYQQRGEFATARTLYARARRTYAVRLGPVNNGGTAASFNQALMDIRLGDYDEGRSALRQVVATWTRALGSGHPNVARATSVLAESLLEEGRDSEALPYFMQALRIRERALGPDHRDVAITLSNLALTLDRLGQPREALERSTRAVGIWERSSAKNSLPGALTVHGQLLARAGDVRGAEQAYARALNIRTAQLGPAHPNVASDEVALAGIEARLERTDEALARGLRGQRIAREHALLTLASLSERQALEYVRSWPKGLDMAASFAKTPADREAVLDEVIRGRALTLDEMSLRRRAAGDGASDETRALWDQLRATRQRLANLTVKGTSRDPRGYTVLVDDARRAKEEAERALAEQSSTFRTNTRRAAAGVTDVRAALPPSAALVSFYRYDRTVVTPSSVTTRPASTRTVPSYMGFVLRAGAAEPVAVPLGSAAAVDAAIGTWRQELLGAIAASGALPAAETALRASGTALRRRIWDPLAAHLDGATRVFVVPDSALNLVPVAALPAPGGGYLLERGPVIHYLSAERDLVAPDAPRAGPDGFLAVGGPTFSSGELFAALRSGSASSKPGDSARRTPPPAAPAPALPVFTLATRAADVGTVCASFQSMRFEPLPAARSEAEEVASLWTSGRTGAAADAARTLVGSVASESAFKQLAPGRRVLHLATHGFFLGDECDTPPAPGTRAVGGLVTSPAPSAPRGQIRRRQTSLENPLLLSGLAMAGANRRAAAGPDEDDGILTAEEVAGLDLTGVDWAVLSACETGLGLVRVGEGVLGLRRAFQTAGARTVIMSLWSVEDRATRQWMRALYQGRFGGGLDTADSVREAALTVLKARRAAGQSGHPFFWAGFAAAGDWR